MKVFTIFIFEKMCRFYMDRVGVVQSLLYCSNTCFFFVIPASIPWTRHCKACIFVAWRFLSLAQWLRMAWLYLKTLLDKLKNRSWYFYYNSLNTHTHTHTRKKKGREKRKAEEREAIKRIKEEERWVICRKVERRKRGTWKKKRIAAKEK